MQMEPRRREDPDSLGDLDDSWFDRPGKVLRREDVMNALRARAPQRESIELDDPWFLEDE